MADPYCLAMVLCDAIHRDPSTSKFTILGTFTNFTAPEFPAKIRFAVYFLVTDGLGDVTLRFQLVSGSGPPIDALNEEDDPNRLFMIRTNINFESSLMVIEGALGIETILPSAGIYHCELWGNREPLMTRRLSAIEQPMPGEEQVGGE